MHIGKVGSSYAAAGALPYKNGTTKSGTIEFRTCVPKEHKSLTGRVVHEVYERLFEAHYVRVLPGFDKGSTRFFIHSATTLHDASGVSQMSLSL